MKKNINFFLIILFLGCTSEKAEVLSIEKIKKDVFISGQIEDYYDNKSTNQISVYVNDFLVSSDGNDYKFSVDSLGHFTMSFPVPRKQDVFIYRNIGFPLIVEPGDSLSLSFKENLDSQKEVYRSLKINSTSSTSTTNKQLVKFNQNKPQSLDGYHDKLKVLKPNDFKIYHDNVYKIENEYIESFIANNDITDDLKQWLLVKKEIEPMSQILNYKLYYQMYGLGDAMKLKLDESFYKDLKNLSMTDESKLINTSLTSSFLNSYYFYFIDQTIDAYYKTSQVEEKDGYKKIETEKTRDSLILGSIIKISKEDKLLAQLLMNEALNLKFNNNNIEYYNEEKSTFNDLFVGSYFKDYHEGQVTFIKNLIEEPILDKDIKMLDFNTDNSSEFIDEIVKNANGKIIYIDNWATWCGPCKSEFKYHTPQFVEKYSNDVEFVYLCFQSDEKLWKPTISQYNLKGKHYYIKRGQEQALINLFNISGYPTYTIINKKGEIIKSDFKYRPSKKETSIIIDKLISE